MVEQLQFDEILEVSKRGAESLRERAREMFTPHSNFNFRETASLTFANSTESVGLQVADILAGFCMRYVKGFFTELEQGKTHRSPDIRPAAAPYRSGKRGWCQLSRAVKLGRRFESLQRRAGQIFEVALVNAHNAMWVTATGAIATPERRRQENQSKRACSPTVSESAATASSTGTRHTRFSTIVLVCSSAPSGSIPIIFNRSQSS